MMSGDGDRLWPSGFMADWLTQRMKSQRSEVDVENVRYAALMHAFPFGYMPTSGFASPTHSIEEASVAARDVWQRIVDFLARNTR